MRNTEIAQVFTDIADLLELKGENPFKVRAYQAGGPGHWLSPQKVVC